MKSRRNLFMVVLMASSVMLLTVLQALWLVNCYEDEKASFKKETGILFRSTLRAMHDEMLEKSIEPMAEDSVSHVLKRKRFDLHKTRKMTGAIFEDTLDAPDEDAMRVEVFISTDRDSIGHLLRPLVSKINARKDTLRKFIFRLGEDSLNTDSVRKEFQKTLHQSDIHAHFRVVHARGDVPLSESLHQQGEIVTEIVRLGPLNQYGVAFRDVGVSMLTKIIPQLAFSIVLTLLIIGSFYMMYRHLIAQEKLMHQKNDFISNITHELKTPLATVSVALEALKDFKVLNDQNKTAEYLAMAQQELSRLTVMTDKILKTSLLEHTRSIPVVERVELDKLIVDVLNRMKVVVESLRIQVSYRKSGSDFHVRGSEEHLNTLMYNLIDNAVKYRRDEGVIDIRLKDIGTSVEISVRDNGIGIPSEYRDKIIEKFFRVPHGDVHNIKGYGLGLSYVAEVVSMHAGDIKVESNQEKGSNFIITLPKRS